MPIRMWLVGLLAVAALGLTSWSPALSDPGSQLRLSASQAQALGHDAAPDTIAPVVDLVDDPSGRTMYERAAYHHHAIGSITKLMTAVLTIRHLSLNRVVKVSRKAASIPGSTMGLVAGDKLTVRALLYGLLLPSGNDAAEELAETLAGSDRDFARMANAQAKQFGLHCSHYVTPYGLDARGQYSCAGDVVTMTRIVLRTPLLARIVRTQSAVVHGVCCNEVFPLTNTNALLGTYPGAIGVKTGTTDQAGGALSAAAAQRGHTIIAVVLGSSDYGRFGDAESLLDFGFSNFVWPKSPALMWATPTLESKKQFTTAPIPAWESPWTWVTRVGTPVAPADFH